MSAGEVDADRRGRGGPRGGGRRGGGWRGRLALAGVAVVLLPAWAVAGVGVLWFLPALPAGQICDPGFQPWCHEHYGLANVWISLVALVLSVAVYAATFVLSPRTSRLLVGAAGATALALVAASALSWPPLSLPAG